MAPAIARHGDAVIPDIVRGMEELQVLTSLADEDFIAQITFGDAAEKLRSAAQRIHAQILEGELQPPSTTHLETRSQSLVARVSDQDQLYAVESGKGELTGHKDEVQTLTNPRIRAGSFVLNRL